MHAIDQRRRGLQRALVVGVMAAFALVVTVSGTASAAQPAADDSAQRGQSGRTASSSGADDAQRGSEQGRDAGGRSGAAAQDDARQKTQAQQQQVDAASRNDGDDAQAKKQDAAAREQQDRDEKAAAQRVRDEAVARQEKARAAAARQAARLAAAGTRAKTSWAGHGRPTKMMIIRSRSVDLVADGRLTRQVPRSAAAAGLPALSRLVPKDWLTINGDTADLAAAVVLTPGVTLSLGPDVTTVRLAGGPTAADAASIYTGSGRVLMTGVTVTSFDPTTGQPMAIGPGRPSIAASEGGRFEAVDSTVTDLGTAPYDPTGTTDTEARPAVSLGQGSTGSLVRTAFIRNGAALLLGGSTGVRLRDVHISDSAGDGLTLRADNGTTFAGVTTDHNGENGVIIRQPSTDRPITGISATGNKLFGLAATNQTKGEINGVVTADNAGGGVRLGGSTGMTVNDLRSTNDAVGLYTHIGSARLTVNRAHITGARRGLQIEKTTRDLTVNAATIDAATISGIAVGGQHIALNQVTVNDSATGMRVERGSGDVTATGLTVTGGENGVVALAATRNVVLDNLTTSGVSRVAVRTFSPDLHLVNSRLNGSSIGVDSGAATLISTTAVVASDEGIRSRSADPVIVDNAEVSAVTVGVDVAPGSPLRLIDSHVDALEAIRGDAIQAGQNQLSLPPLNLLGAIGVPLILLAILLEQVHAFRHGSMSTARRLPPPLPRAAALS